MPRDPTVIEYLNRQLTNELTAVNQYFLHARTLEHWGVTTLGRFEYAESIDEMKHADALIQRILFLDGLPNVQRLDPIRVGEDVEILRSDQALEEKALSDLREDIAYCESVRDFVSRDQFLKILESEEKHVDFPDRQFDLIKQIGIERYIMLNAAAAPEQNAGWSHPVSAALSLLRRLVCHGGMFLTAVGFWWFSPAYQRPHTPNRRAVVRLHWTVSVCAGSSTAPALIISGWPALE